MITLTHRGFRKGKEVMRQLVPLTGANWDNYYINWRPNRRAVNASDEKFLLMYLIFLAQLSQYMYISVEVSRMLVRCSRPFGSRLLGLDYWYPSGAVLVMM